MESVNSAPYLCDRPASFVDSADVILKLDSGDKLPAHSSLLSLHSDVLSEMLSLNRSGDSRLRVLPFPDCTLDAANNLLKYIYARYGEERVSVEGAETVAVLANKFCMENILKDVDNFLADKGADVNKAVHWLSVAGNNNLVRLAAKAERFLVQEAGRLSDSPEAVDVPLSSLLRMLDRRHAAIEGMKQAARTYAAGQPTHTYGSTDAWSKVRALKPDFPSVQ